MIIPRLEALFIPQLLEPAFRPTETKPPPFLSATFYSLSCPPPGDHNFITPNHSSSPYNNLTLPLI